MLEGPSVGRSGAACLVLWRARQRIVGCPTHGRAHYTEKMLRTLPTSGRHGWPQQAVPWPRGPTAAAAAAGPATQDQGAASGPALRLFGQQLLCAALPSGRSGRPGRGPAGRARACRCGSPCCSWRRQQWCRWSWPIRLVAVGAAGGRGVAGRVAARRGAARRGGARRHRAALPRRRVLCKLLQPQLRLDASDQLLLSKGFGHIIVAARLRRAGRRGAPGGSIA